jgi:hypothetical protein
MNIQSVAKLSHCCTPATDQVLQNCHTVVDGTHCCKIVTLLRIGNGGQLWRQCGDNVDPGFSFCHNWNNSRVCVRVYIQRLLRVLARYKFLLYLISRFYIPGRYNENV